MSDPIVGRLRVGLATLMREPHAPSRARLLDAAVDAGIRKFDTAPIYGLGTANKDLASLIRRREESLQVTTKFGRRLSVSARLIAPVQAPIRAIIRRSSQVRHTARAGSGGVQIPPAPSFRALREELVRTCDSFQSELLSELLTHEIPIDPPWKRLLEEVADRRGELPVRAFGLSGNGQMLASYPPRLVESAQVVQTPLLDDIRTSDQVARVYFGVLSPLLHKEGKFLAENGGALSALSDRGLETDVLPLLLTVCMRTYPQADFVLGTSSTDHLLALIAGVKRWSKRDELDWHALSRSIGITNSDRYKDE